MVTRTLAALAVSAAMTAAALAQPAPLLPTTLTVVAEGREARAPDIAEVSGGVVTAAPTAEAAMRDNAAKMAAVVAAVRGAGIAERDIQTRGIDLAPQYRYVENQPPLLTGYQASNSVALRLRRLADAGRLLDTLVRVGANQISGPVFRVENSDAVLDAARVAAMATARARGQLYAGAAALKIRRIMSIVESANYSPDPRPMATMVRMDKAEASTPVVPGEVALSVSVTVVFELE